MESESIVQGGRVPSAAATTSSIPPLDPEGDVRQEIRDVRQEVGELTHTVKFLVETLLTQPQ